MDMISLIKKAALDAAEEGKPAAVVQGTVTGTGPLKIQIDQKLTLTEEFLLLSRNVTDHAVEMTVAHRTETILSHEHEYKGRKTFLIHNSLKPGEKVILVRVQGGQKYLVLDRAG